MGQLVEAQWSASSTVNLTIFVQVPQSGNFLLLIGCSSPSSITQKDHNSIYQTKVLKLSTKISYHECRI